MVAFGLSLRILYWTLTDKRVASRVGASFAAVSPPAFTTPDVRDSFVLTTLPVEDDVRDLHVSAFDRELRPLDVLLPHLPFFGLDLRAWIRRLDCLLA
jgi:hypothetical protein